MDFWGKRKNPVKTGKNGVIPELSTVVHNLSTESQKLWISLLTTCRKGMENPKTPWKKSPKAFRPKTQSVLGILGRRIPKMRSVQTC